MDEQKQDYQPQQQHAATGADNKMLIPAAIIVAGLIIGGAIVYVNTPAPSGGNVLPPGGNEPAGNAAEILKIKQTDFVLGSPSAKVVFVEYSDYQCPFCGRFFRDVEPKLIENYVKTGKVAFVYRDFAFLGEESFRAAEAARCAGEQNKYWEYHNYLFSKQSGENEGAFSDANLKKFAQTVALDQAKFGSCLDSGKFRQAVEDAAEEGRSIGVNGTPASFVNGKLVSGAQPWSFFQNAIDAELKK